MKTILLIVTILLCAITISEAANVYVATNGDDGNDGLSTGAPKLTIQAGITALAAQGPGNTLYLRGGTYTTIPVTGTLRGISYAALNNATSWDNAYTITSYPGEWAIIDADSYTDARIQVFYSEDSSNDIGGVGFIAFERFEIKNAQGSTHSAGISGTGGPFKFRFLYIHDCNCTTNANLPAAIRLGNGSGNVTVEYCWFYRNGAPGTDQNAGQVLIMSDYLYRNFAGVALHNASGFATARHDNVIRYNLFDGGTTMSVGYFDKAAQLLASDPENHSPVDSNSWSTSGSKIHHNIFVNHTTFGLGGITDFNQIYNNIVDMTGATPSGYYGAIDVGMDGVNSDFRNPTWKTTVYNNTTLGGYGGIVFQDDLSAAGTRYDNWYAINNIIDAPTDYDKSWDLSLGTHYTGTWTWDVDNLLVAKNNYFYRPANTTLAAERLSTYTLTTLNATAWADNNRSHAHDDDDSLYAGTSGASKYTPNASYTDYSSVSTGGLGGAHPYLAGVTIPSYLGAVNPADSAWVAGVLNLASTTVLQAGTSLDPAWIEGNVSLLSTATGCTISGASMQ